VSVLVAATVVFGSGCVSPARSYGAYENKAETTASDALSAVETARLAVVAASKRQAFAPFLSVVLGEAEDKASSVQATFDSLQPPDERSDKLRSELDDALQSAVSLLADLRIAVRGGRLEVLPGKLGDLTSAAGALRTFQEAHQ